MKTVYHGTLQDIIDYRALIQSQANAQRVISSRKCNKVNVKNTRVQKKKYKRLTYK